MPAEQHGAVSTPYGRVQVTWDGSAGEARSSLSIIWQEIGGPPVATPSRLGYGASAIRDLIAHELAGAVDLEFAAAGVYCKIAIPMAAFGRRPAAEPSSPRRSPLPEI